MKTKLLILSTLLAISPFAGIFQVVEAEVAIYSTDTSLSAANASFWGEDAGDRSGGSVSRVGDVNGDGYDDILIGADSDDDGGNSAGQTYLILGKASGWAMDIDLSVADASFWGEDTSDLSGRSVSGAGDVNGDGYDDILIGAPGDDDGGSGAGQTYLILGKSSGWAMDTDLSASDASFWGEDATDGSGRSVSGAGDVNGDGYDDILVGAVGDGDGGSFSGQTYLILGKASGWAMDTDLSVSDASFWGEDTGDQSGRLVTGAGDVNGDGYDDILIGAYLDDDGGNNAGQTYLILGKAAGWVMDTDLSASDASFWGEGVDDQSGLSASGAGDVNGDGYDDILVGAHLNGEGTSNGGQTYLILGKSSGWAMDTDLSVSDASFLGEYIDARNGYSVSGAGDVNSDGYDDILIGAYLDGEGGFDVGQTYLILGKVNGWAMDADLSISDASFWGEINGYWSGYSVSGAGDVNGDGYDDILVGAYFGGDGGFDAGQSYLVFGPPNLSQISNLITGLDVENLSSEDFETGSGFGSYSSSETLRVKDSNGLSIADIVTDLSGATDIGWSGVTGDSSLSSGVAFVHNLTSAAGTAASFTLYVPKVPTHSSVTICPGASSLAEVIPGCASEVVKTEADGDTSIVNIGGQDYWAITGMTGTGGFGSGAENASVYIDLDAQPATAPSTISTAPEVAVSTADSFYLSYIPSTTEFAASDSVDIAIPFDWSGLAVCAATGDADGAGGNDHTVAVVDTQIIRYTFTGVTTTALATGVEFCFTATTPATPGNYNIPFSDTNDGDYGPALIYVGDDNDVTLTATIPITLSLRIKEPATTADTNLCALGVLNPGSVNSCSYRIAAGTNISTGLQVFTFADNQLNTAGDSADIDDVAGGATVTAGVEEHGILVTLGTGWTVGGSFSASTDEVLPLTETLILDAAASVSDSVEANWSTITHSASVNAGTSGGSYDQLVTYRAWVDT